LCPQSVFSPIPFTNLLVAVVTGRGKPWWECLRSNSTLYFRVSFDTKLTKDNFSSTYTNAKELYYVTSLELKAHVIRAIASINPPVVLTHLGPTPIYLCPSGCLGWPLSGLETKCVLSNWLRHAGECAHPLHCGINTREPHDVQAFLAH